MASGFSVMLEPRKVEQEEVLFCLNEDYTITQCALNLVDEQFLQDLARLVSCGVCGCGCGIWVSQVVVQVSLVVRCTGCGHIMLRKDTDKGDGLVWTQPWQPHQRKECTEPLVVQKHTLEDLTSPPSPSYEEDTTTNNNYNNATITTKDYDSTTTTNNNNNNNTKHGRMASRTPSPSVKATRKILSINQKYEIIQEYDKGSSRAQLREKYGLKKTTIHDLIKSRDKVREAMMGLESSNKGKDVYRKRRLPQENLDTAIFKWYTQQRAEGVPVRGIDIQHAAIRLAAHLGNADFKCSDGWLWRFRRRHGIVNKTITGELLSADANAVEPFVPMFRELKEQEQEKTVQKKISAFIKAVPSPVDKRQRADSETSDVSASSVSSINLPSLPSSSTTSPIPPITPGPVLINSFEGKKLHSE